MNRIIKQVLAIVLSVLMLSGSFTCFAVELDDVAVQSHKGQYKNYLLLGDSAASGYRDEITDNDKAFNEAYQETVYHRVPGSYSDILANAIIEDQSMTAFAAPGFRTIEIRYMLEDDFDEADDYLFHPSQLNAVGDAGSEEYRAAYKDAIAQADLITLGVGGNDWGAYLGWVVSDVLEKERVADQFLDRAKEIIDNSNMDLAMVEKLFEVARLAGALPELLATIPVALDYGLSTFYKNWDIMIEDIYALNPDVTLMVIGMSDNGIKGSYFDYDGVEGGFVNGDSAGQASPAMAGIVEFIMSVGNKPMIEGAEKYGYTYVDISGATYVDSHPDADGHMFIANRIIEELPDAEIFVKYNDIAPGHKYYNDVEYAIKNGIISPVSDTSFAPDEAFTQGQLAEAFNCIFGEEKSTQSSEEVTVFKLFTSLFAAGGKKGLLKFFKGVSIAMSVLTENSFNLRAEITRAQAAHYLRQISEI